LTPWKMKKSGLPPTTASIGCTTTNPHNANSSRNATSSPRPDRPPTTTGGRRGAGWESGVARSVTADPRVQGPGPGGQRLGTGDGEPFPEQPLEHVGPVVLEQAGGLVGQQPLRHRVGRVDELHHHVPAEGGEPVEHLRQRHVPADREVVHQREGEYRVRAVRTPVESGPLPAPPADARRR